jgi:hypothetical protein
LRGDKGDQLRNVFLELLADGGACRDYQLASRSYSQRDGCRRVHTCYGADNLPQTGAIFDRFGGINGSAYSLAASA